MGPAFVVAGFGLMVFAAMPFDWAGLVLAFGGVVWILHEIGRAE